MTERTYNNVTVKYGFDEKLPHIIVNLVTLILCIMIAIIVFYHVPDTSTSSVDPSTSVLSFLFIVTMFVVYSILLRDDRLKVLWKIRLGYSGNVFWDGNRYMISRAFFGRTCVEFEKLLGCGFRLEDNADRNKELHVDIDLTTPVIKITIKNV